MRALRPAAADLAKATPDLASTLKIVNYLLNELAYNPPGSEEGYLFWTAWANHAGNSVFETQDAHGPIRRGAMLVSCSTLAHARPDRHRQPAAGHAERPCSTAPGCTQSGLPARPARPPGPGGG